MVSILPTIAERTLTLGVRSNRIIPLDALRMRIILKIMLIAHIECPPTELKAVVSVGRPFAMSPIRIKFVCIDVYCHIFVHVVVELPAGNVDDAATD